MELTENQLSEYLKCKGDFFYFCKEYVKIISLDKGIIPFCPRGYQRTLITLFHNHNRIISKIPRQYGKTIVFMAYFLWVIIFNEDKVIGILANKGDTARKILAKLQFSYEQLPFWMQQGVVEWNKGSIRLQNGSKVLASATTEAAGRSDSYNYILLDEFAFVPRRTAEDFYKSIYPTLSSGTTTKIGIVSTPNGMNLFHKFWKDAENGHSNFKHYHVHWSEYEGRDEKWKNEQVKAMGQDAFDQEFGCEFLGSSNSLISGRKLRELAFSVPIHSTKVLDIYEDPLPGHIYLALVDTAHGQGLDYSAINVIDITQTPYTQVAKFKDDKIDPLVYPNMVKSIGDRYNNAHVLVEINDLGKQVADALWQDLEYENLILITNSGKNTGQKVCGFGQRATQRGLKMSQQTKALGCAAIKSMIENDYLLVQDHDTIAELSTFVATGSSFAAESGFNDDMAMTLVLFGWLSKQEYFKDLTNLNLREKLFNDQLQSLQEQVPPFFFPRNNAEEFEMGPDGNLWKVVKS